MSAKAFGSLWAPDRLLKDYGAGLTKMTDNAEFDLRHDASSARLELKAARARSGVFTFQYIRPDCFDVCVCLAWEGGNHRYWLIPANKIRPLLAKQHRSFDSFQLRVGRHLVAALAKYEIAPSTLRDRLDVIALGAVRGRHPVRLDPILEAVEGWPSVAASIRRRMKDCGLSDWSFVLKPVREQVDPGGPALLPYPRIYEGERRIEAWVYPEPVIGRHDLAATAGALFDFLIQNFDPDDVPEH
jgi:hypothetical protein